MWPFDSLPPSVLVILPPFVSTRPDVSTPNSFSCVISADPPVIQLDSLRADDLTDGCPPLINLYPSLHAGLTERVKAYAEQH